MEKVNIEDIWKEVISLRKDLEEWKKKYSFLLGKPKPTDILTKKMDEIVKDFNNQDYPSSDNE